MFKLGLLISSLLISSCGSTPNPNDIQEEELQDQEEQDWQSWQNQQDQDVKQDQQGQQDLQDQQETMIIKDQQRIAILELKDYTQGIVTESERLYLSNLIRQTAGFLPKNKYVIMTQENILSLLPEGKVLEDCLKDCEVLVGRELGAHYIITGEIVRFGQALRITLKLHESRSGILKASDTISGVKIEELENVIKGATLGLFQAFVPEIKMKVARLKKNFIKEKLNFTLTDQVNIEPIDLQPLIDPIRLPDQIELNPKLNSKSIHLGRVNPNMIILFDQAIAKDQDMRLSNLQKLNAWQMLIKEKISLEIEKFARQRIEILQQVVWAEQFLSVKAFHQSYAHPINKIKQWETLLSIEPLKTYAQTRIKDLQILLNQQKLPYYQFDQLYEAFSNFIKKRNEQMNADWEKLSRLLNLASIPKADKTIWVNAFIESYGTGDFDDNPYFEKIRSLHSLSPDEYQQIQKESQLEKAKKKQFLSIFPSEFWDTHPHRIKEAKIDVQSLIRNIKPKQNEPLFDQLFPKHILIKHIEFIRMDEGAFLMGEDFSRYVHMKPFYISRSEITSKDYMDCVSAGVCAELASHGECHWKKSDRSAHPINCIDWQEAHIFAKWLGGDLPSQAQWEYATRIDPSTRADDIEFRVVLAIVPSF